MATVTPGIHDIAQRVTGSAAQYRRRNNDSPMTCTLTHPAVQQTGSSMRLRNKPPASRAPRRRRGAQLYATVAMFVAAVQVVFAETLGVHDTTGTLTAVAAG
ncbi:MAG: hypothetical protein ACRDN0_13475, partial [Trebonia sp.]